MTLASSSLVDHSELPESDGDYSNLELVIIGSSLVAQGEPVDNTSSDASNLLVEQSEPLVDGGEPQQIDALGSLLVDKSEPLTREALGKILGVSRETIRKWQMSGELERQGWVVVPGTGSTPKNPIKYRKQV